MKDQISHSHSPKTISICIVLVVTAFVMNVQRSVDLVMDQKPSTWSINAIPYALSRMVFNQEKYTSNETVANAFFHGRNTVSNNAGIEEALNLDPANLSQNFSLWDNEDKGVIDFVSASFKVLGYKSERIIYFYYLIIFVSALAFLIANYAFVSRIVILLQFLIMLYLVQPMVAYNPQLTSLGAPRVFPVLAIIASLHCIFFALEPKRKLISMFLLAIQVAVIICVLHLRIVTYWQIIAIVSVCMGLGIRNYIFNRFNFMTLLPIVFIVFGLIGLKLYRNSIFPLAYQISGQPITRVVWHNVLSGLVFSPYLSDKFNIRIDDRSIIDAVGKYLIENDRSEEWLRLGVLEQGGREHGYPGMRWADYEKIAKEVFYEKCSIYPLQCVSAFFYYKPLSLVKNLGWAYGLRIYPADLDLFTSNFQNIGNTVKIQSIQTTQKLDSKKQRAYFWSPIAIFLMFIPFLILSVRSYDYKSIMALALFAICSCIPSIVAYPGVHTIIDTIIVFGMFAYTLLVVILQKMYIVTFSMLKNYNVQRGIKS